MLFWYIVPSICWAAVEKLVTFCENGVRADRATLPPATAEDDGAEPDGAGDGVGVETDAPGDGDGEATGAGEFFPEPPFLGGAEADVPVDGAETGVPVCGAGLDARAGAAEPDVATGTAEPDVDTPIATLGAALCELRESPMNTTMNTTPATPIIHAATRIRRPGGL
jgi:hypothetical protein